MAHARKSLNVFGVLFVLAGLVLTLENFGLIKGVSRHWAVFIIVFGSTGILLFYGSGKTNAAMAWLGSFFLFLGTFFYYLNLTSWGRLFYLWPVFLGIFGMSFLVLHAYHRKNIFAILSIFFISLFLVFSLVFSISLKFWPVSLVIFGASLFSINYFGRKKTSGEKGS